MELGQKVGADLLLATDLDADRLGVAFRNGSTYELLKVNQLGALLLNYTLQTKQLKGTCDIRIRATNCRELVEEEFPMIEYGRWKNFADGYVE